MRNDHAYLNHLRLALDTIEEYIEGVSFEEFASNRMMIDAVVRELEIIGEASNNLSKDFKHLHSEVLWRRIKDMRNFLIHEYFGVNKKMVWDTCKNDLQTLKKFLDKHLDHHS